MKSYQKQVFSHSAMSNPLQPTRLLSPLNSLGKNTGVGCHFLLQEIFPTQGLNLGLPHCGQTLYQRRHQRTKIEIDGTINGLHLKYPKTFPYTCLSKNCLPRTLPRSRKKLQVYSTVPGCWPREMLKQGCSKRQNLPCVGSSTDLRQPW